MTIEKHYEISCDKCGQADHWQFSIKKTEKQMISDGWFKKGKKHFCCKDCLEEYIKSKEAGK